MTDIEMKKELDFYAEQYWAEWDEGSQEFAELVIDSGIGEVRQHAYIINMNLASIMGIIASEFSDGERDHEDVVRLAKVMAWVDAL